MDAPRLSDIVGREFKEAEIDVANPEYVTGRDGSRYVRYRASVTFGKQKTDFYIFDNEGKDLEDILSAPAADRRAKVRDFYLKRNGNVMKI